MELDRFKMQIAMQTSQMVAELERMRPQGAVVDLSIPEVRDLLQDRAQQQMNTAGFPALKQRLARAEFRARAKAARLSKGLRK